MSERTTVIYTGGRYNRPRHTLHALDRFQSFVRVRMALHEWSYAECAKRASLSPERWRALITHDIHERDAARIATGLGFADVDELVAAVLEFDKKWARLTRAPESNEKDEK